MVDKANSGHLGAPFGCAPLSNALWGKIMRFSPTKRWINRDRFVLSCGHASALLYSMLHLTGNGLGGPYEVTMDALKQFRKAGSSTPGHPEFRMTSGVEVTTGPLGQGFANAVGMAIAEAHLAARFNREGFPLFDNYTFVLAGDGCLMEGISTEAASLAGHLKLHKLIAFYDDNKATIDGKTDISFSEDIPAKFAAMGWNVLHIANGDEVDATIYEKVVQEAKSQTEKPTIIVMKTTIGCGAGVGIEGEAKAHGGKFSTLEAIRQKWFSPDGLSKLGGAVEQRVAAMVQSELDHLGSDPCADGTQATVLPKFYVPRPVMKKFRDAGARGDKMAEEWEKLVEKYCQTFSSSDPDVVKDLKARMEGRYVSDEWDCALADLLNKERADIEANLRELSNNAQLPENGMGLEPRVKRKKTFDSGFKYKAGRVYASQVLKCFAQHNPALIGGSPDVASSCGAHFPDIQGHFLHPSYAEKYKGASYGGRYIHFGVREHAALGVLNGISSYSFLIPYSSLFTIFYQYGLPAIRMASISKFPVLYIGTHDSIDLGEDGPTHQPVEVLPQLRAMPNLLVIRPANVAEMVGAFQIFAEQYSAPREIGQYVDPKPLKRRPVFIMTSRGELGVPYKRNSSVEGQDGIKRGAYVIHECYDRKGSDEKTSLACLPDIVLIGSGQDVALVMKTKELLLQWSADFNARLKGAFDGYPKAMPVIAEPIKVRIVSMPCWELFDEQDQDYQDSVLLSNYRDILRIYVEKAATKNTGHDKYAHFSVLMPSYGLSGTGADVEQKLEFTPEYIAAKVWAAWIQRGRRLAGASGDQADTGLETWVSRLSRRAGEH
jgi:transketolase